MEAGADPVAATTRLLSALDRAAEAVQALALQASRSAAFNVISGAERTGERIPWLRARGAALHERERTSRGNGPMPEDRAASWSDLSAAAERLAEAAEGVDPMIDGADLAAAGTTAPRLERLREALDVVEERLARVEASSSSPSR